MYRRKWRDAFVFLFSSRKRTLICSECSWIHYYICSTRFPCNCSSSFPGTIKPMSCRPSGNCPMTCSSYWEEATMKWCNPVNSMCWLSRYRKKNRLSSNDYFLILINSFLLEQQDERLVQFLLCLWMRPYTIGRLWFSHRNLKVWPGLSTGSCPKRSFQGAGSLSFLSKCGITRPQHWWFRYRTAT